MHCVSWLNCGDLGTWLAAIATFLAVIVALRTSDKSVRTALRLQRNEHLRIEKREEALRHQLAVAFDGDLYILIGQLEFFITMLRQAQGLATADAIWNVLEKSFPEHGLVMMERLIEKAEVFPPGLAGQLIAAVGRWQLFQNRPPLPVDDRESILITSYGVLEAATGLKNDLEVTRRELRSYILPGTRMTPD